MVRFLFSILSSLFIGVITELEEDSGLIDGQFYFSRSLIPKVSLRPLQIGDNVQYKAVRKSENQQWIVSEIIQVKNDEWEGEKKGQTCVLFEIFSKTCPNQILSFYIFWEI